MSSSSESDDEERRKLASVVCGYEASLAGSKSRGGKWPGSDKPDEKAKKSLRNNGDGDDGSNVLQTTPEFKSFISRKLDAFLEKEVIDYITENVSCNNHDGGIEAEGGVKLLLQSKTCVSESSLIYVHKNKVNGRNSKCKKSKKRSASSSSESDEEEKKRFCSAAVSADAVLSGTAILAHKKEVP